MKNFSLALLVSWLFFHSMATWAEVSSKQEVLKVGYTGSYKPMNFLASGQLIGLDRQILDKLADKLEIKIEYIQTPLTELWQALEEGKIDLASGGLSITDSRSEKVLFTDPYLVIGQVPIIRYADAKRFTHKRALFKRDIRIGAIVGTSAVDLINRKLPNSLLQLYPSQAQVIDALRNKEIDFYIHDEPTSWVIASSSDYSDLTSTFYQLNTEPLAFAVAKNNQALALRINNALTEISDAGIVEKLQKQWLPEGI